MNTKKGLAQFSLKLILLVPDLVILGEEKIPFNFAIQEEYFLSRKRIVTKNHFIISPVTELKQTVNQKATKFRVHFTLTRRESRPVPQRVVSSCSEHFLL